MDGIKEVIFVDNKKVSRDFSRLGLGLFLFMLIPQIVASVCHILLLQVFPAITEQSWYLWMLSYVPMYFIGFPVLCIIWWDVPKDGYVRQSQPVKIGLGKMFLIICGCMTVAYGLNYVSMFLMEFFSTLKGTAIDNPLESMLDGSGVWISSFVVMIVAPIMEEIVFRWMLYKRLMLYGSTVYIIFSAAVFAMFHGNLFQMLYAFVLGLIFAYVIVLTDKIYYSIILHIVVNALGGGIVNILTNFASETVVSIYSLFVLAVVFVGIIVILLSLRYRNNVSNTLYNESGYVHIQKKSKILLNPGMLLYTILIAIIMFTSMFLV